MGGAPLQAPRRVWLAVKPPIKRQAPEQTAPGGGGLWDKWTELTTRGLLVPKSRARALTPNASDLPRRHTQLSCQSSTSLREGRECSPGASTAAAASLAPAQCPGHVHDKRASVSTPLFSRIRA